MANTLEEQQNALARVRRIKPPVVVDPERPSRRKDRFKYERATIFIRDGVLLDPNRAVLPKWLSTVYDGLLRMSFVSIDKGEVIDAGDGPGVSIDDGGPFRVRVLSPMHWGRDGFLGVGAVIEVPATRYCFIRTEAQGNTGIGAAPRFEPVPSDTPLRGGILPSNFPSSMDKARKLAAAGLKKPEADLAFAEIVKFFEKRKDGAEAFGGSSK